MTVPKRSKAPPEILVRPCSEPGTLVLVLRGEVEREDVPSLCTRARELFESCDADQVVCDVSALDRPSAVTVDTLARLQLAARRRGCRVELLNASSHLQSLIALVGLSEVVPPCESLGVEARGETEKRE